jgi:exosome complex RNA-binding protein Csl4
MTSSNGNTSHTGKGNYYRPMPLDFTILDLLPDRGMIGGVHWRGKRVKDVREQIVNQSDGELTKADLPTTAIAARMRSMTLEGFVENFTTVGSGGGVIWARTPKGLEHLARKDEILGMEATGEEATR